MVSVLLKEYHQKQIPLLGTEEAASICRPNITPEPYYTEQATVQRSSSGKWQT